jgi:spore germination cell wall hydrolase CwlJ-like protein
MFSGPLSAFASVEDTTNMIEGKAVQTETPSYTKNELRLMSAIIFCEAGAESYTGKVAVGIVVMNRVRSDLFPNTVKGVIYEKGQFTPVRNGALAKALKTYDAGNFTEKNHIDSIKAAIKVLEGCKSVKIKGKKVNMKSYLFFSVYLRNRRLKIGNHMFR